MEELLKQQQQAQYQCDYRLVWVCQQKIDRLQRENLNNYVNYVIGYLSGIG